MEIFDYSKLHPQKEAMLLFGKESPNPKNEQGSFLNKKTKKSDIFAKSKPNAHELDILPLKAAAQLDPLVGKHPNLIKPPFLMIINGSVRSGKTCFLTNLCFRDSFYKDVWSKIYLVSPTAHSDPSYKTFLDSEIVEVHCPVNKDEFDASVSDIYQRLTSDEPSLIICDDIVGLHHPNDVLTNLCTKYRHTKTSIIISCQYFMRLSVTIRCNATAYVIFHVINSKELGKIIEELSSSFGDKLEFAYKTIFNPSKLVPYTFMVLDLRNGRIMREFKEIL